MANKTKSTAVGEGLNSSSAPEKLRRYIERFENLQKDKEAVAEDQKQLMAEAKAEGFDTKVMRKVIALRKQDMGKVAEEQAVLDLYLSALGMDYDYSGSAAGDDSASMV